MSLSDEMRKLQEEEDREAWAARSATAGYTGKPCTVCGRIRVYLRNDGRYQCEKCEAFQGRAALTNEGERE